MELIKKNEQYIERILKDSEKVSVDEDIIVPDVKPDVLKVIQADARAYITESGLTNGGMYAKGKLYVNILYIPDSDENGICSVNSCFDFKSKLDNPSVTQDMRLKAGCDVTKADFAAINSRKLSVRACVNVSYEVFGMRETQVSTASDEKDFECINGCVETQRISAVEACEFTVRDDCEIPSGKKAVDEILKTDVRIAERDIKVMQGKLILKGTAAVCILYRTDDGKTDYFDSEIPFTEVFDVYELEESDCCTLDLPIGDVSVELNPDSDGDMRAVTVECVMNVSLCASRQVKTEYISDCFCPGKKTKITANETAVNEYIGRITAQSAIKEIIAPDDKLPKIVKIYRTVAEPEVTGIKTSNGRVDAEGHIKVYILYITDNSKCPVYSFKKDIPFCYSYDCEKAEESMCTEACFRAENASAMLNSSGGIDFRCVLKQDITVTRCKKVNFINDVDTAELDDDGDIVIFFVHDGDTLWNTAKRYSVRPGDIMELNNMENEVLQPGQKIIIPCR